MTEISKGASAKDVQASLIAKHKPKSQPESMAVKNAAHLKSKWETLVPYYHDIGFMKPLTGKDIGQLSQFMKLVGKDHAYGVMHWAIRNWGRFVLDVAKLKGQSTAQKPHIGALLQYCDVAVAGYKTKDVQLTATGEPALLSQEEVAVLVKGGK